MNINNLRKNYTRLSKRERFLLYDAAENRRDKSEMDAIMRATPNVDWTKPDWALPAEQLLKMRLVDLIFRLKYCRDATHWFALAIEKELIDEAEGNDADDDPFFYEMARLLAYFYCVSADVSDAVYKEMGLDVAAWKTREVELFDLDYEEEMTDRRMRNLAFDEQEAHAFVEKICREQGIEKEIELGFTYERKRAEFRKTLKDWGFEQFFKT